MALKSRRAKKRDPKKDITNNIKDLKSNLNLLNPYIQKAIKATPEISGTFTKRQIESKEMQKWSQLSKAKQELTNAKFEAPPREKIDNWDEKTYRERNDMQAMFGMNQGLSFDKSYKFQKKDKKRIDRAQQALEIKSSLLDRAVEREKWLRKNISKKDFLDIEGYIPPKDFTVLKNKPLVELRREYPKLMQFKDKEYSDAQKVSSFIGAAVKQFDRDLVDLYGYDKIQKMEVNAALDFNDMVNVAVENASIGLVKIEDIASMGQDIYVKNGKIFYKGFEVDDEYLTKAGKDANGVAKTMAAFVGAAPTYMAGSSLIKSAVSKAANIQKYTRVANTFAKIDKLAKTDSFWKSTLGEATVFNVMEESAEALIRKTTGQEYTFNNFLNGLAMGAATGSSLQIGGQVYKSTKIKKELYKANKVYKQTKDFNRIKDMPLAGKTFGEIFGEAQFAYLDKFRNQGRKGIERPDALPESKADLERQTGLSKELLERDHKTLVGGQERISAEEVYAKSKVGMSIEKKAIEAKLTKTFEDTAEYDKITIVDQAEKAFDLVNNDIELAKDIINGQAELPSNLRGVALISALEDYAIKARDVELLKNIANSKMVSDTSVHAQEMRLMAERAPESPVAAMQRIRKEREEAVFNKLAKDLEKQANKHYRKIQKQMAKEEAKRAKAITKGAKNLGKSIDKMFKEADREIAKIKKAEDKALMKDVKIKAKDIKKAAMKEIKIRTIADAKNVIKDSVKNSIKKQAPKVDEWEDFISSITC